MSELKRKFWDDVLSLPIHVLTACTLHSLPQLLSEQLHLQMQKQQLVAGAELASLEAHLHLQML